MYTEKQRIANKQRRIILKQKGICTACKTRTTRPQKSTCERCQNKNAINEKARRKKRKQAGICVECVSNKVEINKIRCVECSVSARRRNKLALQKVKRETVECYGGKCYCCGESNIGFLTLDHANNDGAKVRQELKKKYGSVRNGAIYYMILRSEGFPQDRGLRVSCWNCNSGRAMNGGICPHEIARKQNEQFITDTLIF